MRKTAGYIWTDYKSNTEIAEELNITPVWTIYRNTVESGCNMCTDSLMTDYRECWGKKTTDQKAEEPGETIKQTSRCVRPERVNRWPNCMLVDDDDVCFLLGSSPAS